LYAEGGREGDGNGNGDGEEGRWTILRFMMLFITLCTTERATTRGHVCVLNGNARDGRMMIVTSVCAVLLHTRP
jgi:hypothetical protein